MRVKAGAEAEAPPSPAAAAAPSEGVVGAGVRMGVVTAGVCTSEEGVPPGKGVALLPGVLALPGVKPPGVPVWAGVSPPLTLPLPPPPPPPPSGMALGVLPSARDAGEAEGRDMGVEDGEALPGRGTGEGSLAFTRATAPTDCASGAAVPAGPSATGTSTALLVGLAVVTAVVVTTCFISAAADSVEAGVAVAVAPFKVDGDADVEASAAGVVIVDAVVGAAATVPAAAAAAAAASASSALVISSGFVHELLLNA